MQGGIACAPESDSLAADVFCVPNAEEFRTRKPGWAQDNSRTFLGTA